MKLNDLSDTQYKLEEAKQQHTDEEILRPIGISREEFTDEYKARLKKYKTSQPHLYHKIVNGI